MAQKDCSNLMQQHRQPYLGLPAGVEFLPETLLRQTTQITFSTHWVLFETKPAFLVTTWRHFRYAYPMPCFVGRLSSSYRKIGCSIVRLTHAEAYACRTNDTQECMELTWVQGPARVLRPVHDHKQP